MQVNRSSSVRPPASAVSVPAAGAGAGLRGLTSIDWKMIRSESQKKYSVIVLLNIVAARGTALAVAALCGTNVRVTTTEAYRKPTRPSTYVRFLHDLLCDVVTFTGTIPHSVTQRSVFESDTWTTPPESYFNFDLREENANTPHGRRVLRTETESRTGIAQAHGRADVARQRALGNLEYKKNTEGSRSAPDNSLAENTTPA
ncbi:hypothetical protein EVAR_34508_1 [Eumeta japonica]|uniref:Uncharacterized protein n=1 Tax=Eumeta variegata TaxID=151549 RepID=A0A4C1Z6Z2_EUMVA|nr:hypothetical protein EVAR_34508_1 [Eumeta japonica]